MPIHSEHIPYAATNAFSGLVNDFVANPERFASLGTRPVNLQGLQQSIEERLKLSPNRDVIVARLREQYKAVDTSAAVLSNIESLASENTFTITTAHQNNLFTGPLYFIYKILHVIQLAKYCKSQFPQYNFVPVFYLGSEDADLEELNHIHLTNSTFIWETQQTGAVGRMKVDASLLGLLDRLQGELGVLPKGEEWITLLRSCYVEGCTIADATFQLVDKLFSKYGLVVLNPDHRELKRLFLPVIQRDLEPGATAKLLQPSIQTLQDLGYEAQAHVRPINLFYLENGSRKRIDKAGSDWSVVGSSITFDALAVEKEYLKHPERFSPNVILRGLYQCTLLPDVAFVGGGSEIAYWMQFGALFKEFGVPFPLLILRNSFQLIESDMAKKMAGLQLKTRQLFLSAQEISNQLLTAEDVAQFSLTDQLQLLHALYGGLREKASQVDPTLTAHVAAMEKRATNQALELEKKMKRAVRKKYATKEQQLQVIKSELFPQGQLQERYLNCSEFISKYGIEWLDQVAQASLSLEQQFTVLYLP
jgi:bacillithiol biosynthesis cysteine-adding enzyme BshC